MLCPPCRGRASPGPGLRAAWTVAGAASAGAAAPGADQPTGPRDFAPGFCPQDRPGISPVTRAAGDSPAHNASPGASPRNALSINHRNMKSTNFVKLRLHKTVVFCNILLIFAKTLQISRKYFQFPLLSVNYGSTKPPSRRRKKSAAPFLERRSFNLVILFSIWSCARLMVQFLHFGRDRPP